MIGAGSKRERRDTKMRASLAEGGEMQADTEVVPELIDERFAFSQVQDANLRVSPLLDAVTGSTLRETDAAARCDLLFGQVDRLYSAIQRQVNTALFEIRGHNLAQQGAPVGRLADAYLDCLRDQFGDSVDVPDEFRWE